MKKEKTSLIRNDGFQTLLASLVCILGGILVGYIALLIIEPSGALEAIIAREIDKDPQLLIAVQPTRGLDVGAIEYIHKQIVAQRDAGKAVLLVSLELDEVMTVSDRILVMYEGEIVGELDPKTTTVEELGLYMAGAKKEGKQ